MEFFAGNIYTERFLYYNIIAKKDFDEKSRRGRLPERGYEKRVKHLLRRFGAGAAVWMRAERAAAGAGAEGGAGRCRGFAAEVEPEYLQHAAYMSAPKGFFGPDQPLRRAEAAQLVCNLAALSPKNLPESGFADVSPEAWYYGAVCAAAAFFEVPEPVSEAGGGSSQES